MEITYIKDKKIEFRSTILDGLRKYNVIYTGETKSEVMNIYIFDEGEVVGGCQSEMGWNWVYIEALYYEDISSLKAMLNVLYIHYKDKVEGIFFESFIKAQVNDFKSLAFTTLGTFQEKPKGHDSQVLINRTMTTLDQKEHHNIEVFRDDSDYDKLFNHLVDKFNERTHNDTTKVAIQYIAYDKDKIIGGVNGNLNKDYLYVSLLWVEKEYRGQGIASKLMDLIEEEAKEKAYSRSFLGTCTFQAKELYEKRGYKVKMIVPNCPKGYEDFTMVKRLD